MAIFHCYVSSPEGSSKYGAWNFCNPRRFRNRIVPSTVRLFIIPSIGLDNEVHKRWFKALRDNIAGYILKMG